MPLDGLRPQGHTLLPVNQPPAGSHVGQQLSFAADPRRDAVKGTVLHLGQAPAEVMSAFGKHGRLPLIIWSMWMSR